MFPLVFKILTFALKDTAFGGVLKKALFKYGVIKGKINSFKNIFSWTDPNKIATFLKKVSKKELRVLLNKMEKNSFKKGKDLFNSEFINTDNYININSSWIKAGKYQITNKITNTGNLTIIINSNFKIYGPYTYPSVPFNVWKSISQATSNAGTLFWRYWLRSWLPSMIREHIKNELKAIGIFNGKISKDFIKAQDIIDLRKKIRRLEQGFYKNIGKDRRRSIKQIGTYKWKREQAQLLVKNRIAFANKRFGVRLVRVIKKSKSSINKIKKTVRTTQRPKEYLKNQLIRRLK